ncbi:MAG: hypothetical protein JWQ38_3170 [Flavipsychrobacter sp.]|nr:hypothetical protein [Flavipsychrobacter sp.]
MRSLLIAIFIIAGSGYYAQACDLCGCSASSQYMGILPQFHKHFIGIQYQYTGFTADQPSLMDPAGHERAYSFNNTMQVWGRYHVSDRLQLFGFIPYHTNNGDDAGSAFKVKGIGDVSALLNAVIIKDRNDTDFTTWHQALLAGGGIKASTGKYTGITTLDEEGLPNVQAGTGSWDFIVNANYTVRHDGVGLNADAAYTITTAGKAGYKYGNRLNSGLMAFYWLRKNNFSLLPQAGIRYEYSLHDYDNYSRKWLNEGSGGTILFGTVGLQAYYKRYGAKVMYSIPVAQHYADNDVTVKPRLETSLFFLF